MVEISKCVRDAEFLGYTYAYLLFLSNPSLQSSPISSNEIRWKQKSRFSMTPRNWSKNCSTKISGNFSQFNGHDSWQILPNIVYHFTSILDGTWRILVSIRMNVAKHRLRDKRSSVNQRIVIIELVAITKCIRDDHEVSRVLESLARISKERTSLFSTRLISAGTESWSFQACSHWRIRPMLVI